MRVTFEYPQVMKMGLASKIEIPDSADLKEVRSLVFDQFWKDYMAMFYNKIEKHGSPNDVELSYWDISNRSIVIETDEVFRKRLADCPTVQVVFTKPHPPVKT